MPIKRIGSNLFHYGKLISTRKSRKQAKYAENIRKAYNIKKTREEMLREQRAKQIKKISEKDRIRGLVLQLREKHRNRQRDKAMKKGLPTHGSKKRFNRYF